VQSCGPLPFIVTSRVISGVPMPTLSLQLSRSEMVNANDGLLSKRLPSPDAVSAVILKNADTANYAISAVILKNADTANYGCDAVSTLSAFLGQPFQWTTFSKAPGSALGAGMLSAMAEVHHMNM